jgi:hypothetical protein
VTLTWGKKSAALGASAMTVAVIALSQTACAPVIPISSVPPPPTNTGSPAPSQQGESTPSSAARKSTGAESASETPKEDNHGRCQTSQLQARLTPDKAADLPAEDANHTRLALTNVSSFPCTTYGFTHLYLFGSHGERLPTNQHQAPGSPPPVEVHLAPGQSAYEDIRWEVQHSPCSEAMQLRVVPPENVRSVPVPWNLGAVCSDGRLDAGPLFGE